MATSLREYVNSKAGYGVAALIGLLGLAVVVWGVKRNFGDSDGASSSRERVFICAETLKPFNHDLKEGEGVPVYSPHSGKQTGYPAELCFWKKDGTVKDSPTAVLLNEWAGKKGPTFCPDCGRLVVAHNPAPHAGSKPPPLKEQYAARDSAR